MGENGRTTYLKWLHPRSTQKYEIKNRIDWRWSSARYRTTTSSIRQFGSSISPFSHKNTGSSFPKAKPKQTLLTVLRLAVLRLFLLPVYAKWWVEQTSPKIFIFLLALYVLQLFNWSIYSYNIHRTDYDAEVVITTDFFFHLLKFTNRFFFVSSTLYR